MEVLPFIVNTDHTLRVFCSVSRLGWITRDATGKKPIAVCFEKILQSDEILFVNLSSRLKPSTRSQTLLSDHGDSKARLLLSQMSETHRTCLGTSLSLSLSPKAFSLSLSLWAFRIFSVRTVTRISSKKWPHRLLRPRKFEPRLSPRRSLISRAV